MFAIRAALGRFRPDYVPGLVGWWDASAGNAYSAQTGGTLVTVGNTEVERLEDLSGNGYHLTGSGGNGEARLQVGPSGQNGLAIISKQARESGDSNYSSNTGASLATNFGTVDGIGSVDDFTAPFTIIFSGQIGYAGDTPLGGGAITTSSNTALSAFVVTSGTLGNDKLVVGSRYPGTNAALSANRYYVGYNAGLSGGGTTGTALPINSQAFVVIAVLFDGAGSRYSINGGTWTQFGDANYSDPIKSLGVLCDPPSGGQNSQKFGELCLFDGTISDADRISVVAYLMDKWGVS